MKLSIIHLCLFLLVSSTALTQTVKQIQDSNSVTISVFDAVENNFLSDYTMIFTSATDTNSFDIKTSQDQFFELDKGEVYSVSIWKNDYDTARFEFDYRADCKIALIHVFLPQLTITKQERKKAHKHAIQHSFDPTCDWCGGFKKLKPGLGRFWLYRIHMTFEDSYSTSQYTY